MNKRLLLGCACCSTFCAAAQSLSVGQGGIGLSDNDRAVVRTPDRVQVGQELIMAELPVTVRPPQFYLNVGTSGRYGPYALEDNTLIGNKTSPYTLRMFDYGAHFTLHAAGDTNAVFGPFAATNGALVTLGGSVMTVVRFPPQLAVSLSHPDKIAQLPLMGVAPYNGPLLKELYGLRAKFVALANRVAADTADVEFTDMPTVHSRITGNTFTPVVRTSQRDKQNAVKGAELSAVKYLETLFGQAFRVRSQAITDTSTYHFGMPPGDYVFCAMQKVKDPHAQGVAGLATAIWWTAFHFDGEHPLALSLTAENAITWREVFALDKKD